MLAIKIIVFTIMVTFVYGHIRTIATHEFTVEQYIGKWYEMGQISPLYAKPHPITCGTYHITKNYGNDHSFYENYEFVMQGFYLHYEGQGQIVNSQMNVTIPELNQVNFIYTVRGYNNYAELIINRKDERSYYGLLSQKPLISASTRRLFNQLADEVGVKPYYLTHNNCSFYRNFASDDQ